MLDKDWIDWGGSYAALSDAGLAVPGVMIKTGEGKELLIGNVNDQGGFCDCCNLDYVPIVAYRRVWEPEPEPLKTP